MSRRWLWSIEAVQAHIVCWGFAAALVIDLLDQARAGPATEYLLGLAAIAVAYLALLGLIRYSYRSDNRLRQATANRSKADKHRTTEFSVSNHD